MQNTPILITGCQRSGTTLLNLIMDSHPDVTGIDEMQYQPSKAMEYLSHPDYHPFVSWKLPTAAHNIIDLVKAIPRMKVLWCIRDPRDVVASMIKLQLKISPQNSIPWAAHPAGAINEINNCYPAVSTQVQAALAPTIPKYREISHKDPANLTHSEAVFLGAMCWRLKNELPEHYSDKNVNYKLVNYERLLQNPQQEVRAILEYIGLPWHENALKHHLLHAGKSVGDTDNTRAIDRDNINKWKATLTDEDLSVVAEQCSDTAQKYGYRIR